MLQRRHFLAGLGATAALLPGISFAALPTEARLVILVLRGAMDGLSVVPPLGDPHYASLRASLPVKDAFRLDGFFGLHSALPSFARLYEKDELTVFHAMATPYRDRSHFDAQNLLEGGGTVAHGMNDGWLNRTLGLMGRTTPPLGLAVGQTVPFILTGKNEVTTYAPTQLPAADSDFLALAARVMAHDAALSQALRGGEAGAAMANDVGAMGTGGAGRRNQAPALARVMGQMLASEKGPRLAVADIGGWDTHTGQEGRLNAALKQLDAVMQALTETMQPVWNKTAILALTEFGRTAAVNGSGGTDHGTAGAGFLAGGAVAGGRVVAKWPGLDTSQLYQGRDLAPTTDMRAVLKGVLSAHLGLPADALERVVFPNSNAAGALKGLIRT